jgi:hypothetical protein
VKAIASELASQIDDATWTLLRQHLARDAIILVDRRLELLTVAVAVAEDDTAQVQAWITQGQLAKPTRAQLEAWEKCPETPFKCVIVQPYVLVQLS